MNIQALFESCVRALENASAEDLRLSTERAVHDSRNSDIMGDMDVFNDDMSEDVSPIHIFEVAAYTKASGYMKTTVGYDQALSSYPKQLGGGKAA